MRIDCSDKRETLQIRLNGNDYDMDFPTGLDTTSEVLGMVQELEAYRKKAEGDKGKTAEEQLEALKRYVDEGIELCAGFSATMSRVVPDWSKNVGDAFINVPTWGRIINAMVTLINKASVSDKVRNQMEGER